MALDVTRTLRGGLAGAAAAAVWGAQQPLDRRVFGVPYDDTELLGKLVTRGPAWPVAGAFLHLANGALFGALYANVVATSRLLPPWARGPAAGLAEHLATWPATLVTDRLHPARDEMPALWGDSRAFAQATWRHLLFGTVLGELERRLNASPVGLAPIDDETAQTNGHGSIEHLVGIAAD